MIKRLTLQDRQLVLDFCYKRERENLFIIGSFENYKNTFEANRFLGYFKDDKLVGIAVFFLAGWQSLTMNVDDADPEATNALIDRVIEEGYGFKDLPVFEKYALVMMKQLKQKHSRLSERTRYETVAILAKEDFNDLSTGSEQRGKKEDLENIIVFNRLLEGKDPSVPISDNERIRTRPAQEFLVKVDGGIVSKANIHGVSKQYFQIGGVGTLKEHRGKGYAKQAVSSLCRYYFDQGLKYAILFYDNDNTPAIKMYDRLGFNPVDKFIIASY